MDAKSGRSRTFIPSQIFILILGLLPSFQCITTTHHDKPAEANVATMANTMKRADDQQRIINVTLPMSERQKRLLPYMNYYIQQNRQNHDDQKQQRYRVVFPANQNGINYYQPNNYQTKNQFTPFTESNALPGPFVPMNVNSREQEYATVAHQRPNFSDIYDRLSQLKFHQHRQPIRYNENYDKQGLVQAGDVRKTLIRYLVPLQPSQDGQKIIPTKQSVQTYIPTQVDITPAPQYTLEVKEQVRYSGRPVEFPQYAREEQKAPIRQEIKPIIIIGQRIPSYDDAEKQKTFEEQLKIYEDQQKIYHQQQRVEEEERRKYENQPNYQYVTIQEQNRQRPQDNYTPQIIIQKLPSSNQPLNHIEEPPPKFQQYNPEYKTIIDPPPPNEIYNSVYTKPQPQIQPNPNPSALHSENPNLGYILRKLQETNALPQNLTPENIDNSIKTLMKILNALRKHQRLSKKPIVVPDLPENDDNNQVIKPHVQNVPGTVIQHFPENTPEGGTPGKPGVDYPALSSIPQTTFNCATQRYKGFFGDPDTNCQVWHYCDFNGGQASFLCPNGTIFSQVALTCDWWYNVKCATTPQLYVLNERLYKYILPFSPKFPEDYSGPLVDRYLALKFREMEEKMKKERKKNKSQDEKQESTTQTEKIELDDAEQLRIKNQELDMNSAENRNSEEGEIVDDNEDYKQK